MVTDELRALAKTLDDWIADAPGINAIYLFGSRVRGDHRPDSDVDVRVYFNEWDCCEATTRWWAEQGELDCKALTARLRLPGPLRVVRDDDNTADAAIRNGKKVLTVGRVVCVWTPPKPKP